ncbi:hypothetical protein EJ08DRAFT_620568 [Tothia fuscella]|uniref:E3 ubiquitin-protein ligase listerin n=1 Tax=Tothia fuscella TaxID=1048955 RepID=A0A9P4NGZ4_9PEZI|nr:hypothetical protein EJ08DRAFT_620568 [Tothia fuscella]
MSKRQFKAQASSSRAAFAGSSTPFGSGAAAFSNSTSALSYINELPDLSSISDANTIVAFKNLSKKDSITKGKALEDLQSILTSSETEIEDPVLEAWTNIYPRTSIDSSRRVRQLAHSTQGQISVKSGKRIAKYLPTAIGPWLAGLYDNDKLVVKTAADAIQQVFTTPEKRQALWKAFQQSILEHCQTVFDKESAQTLSDERSVSADEANAKYYRVVTAAIGLLSNLVSSLKEEDYKKHTAEYEALLQDKKLWENALSEDPAVRRAMHKTTRILLQAENTKTSIDVALMSTIYLSKGLDSDQTGSASEYTETVLSLTDFNSAVWTNHWSGKNTAASRLKNFVKRGSQGASLNYWSTVSKIFSVVPAEALPANVTEAQDILKAFFTGVTKKDEPKAYIAAGLRSYVQVAGTLSTHLSEKDPTLLLRDNVLPLVFQYIRPTPEKSKWDIPDLRSAEVVLDAIKMRNVAIAVDQEWPTMSSQVADDIKQSSEEKASQDRIGLEGERYSAILGALLKIPSSNKIKLQGEAKPVVDEAIRVCQTSQGKHYGAAAVLASITPITQSSLLALLKDFVRNDLASLYLSPSYEQLATVLVRFENEDFFEAVWMSTLETVLQTPSEIQIPALKHLLAQRHTISDSQKQALRRILAPFLLQQVDAVIESDGDWAPIMDIINTSTAASTAVVVDVLSKMTESLLTLAPNEVSTTLSGFRAISKKSSSVLQNFLSTSDGKKLLPDMLLLTESSDDAIAQSASDLNAILHSLLGDAPHSADAGHSIVELVKDGLSEAGPNSVSVQTLVAQALSLITTKAVPSATHLLPPIPNWSAALVPFFNLSIPQDFAIAHSLASAVYLVQPPSSATKNKIERDSEGYSTPLRMALYTTRLLSRSRDENLGLGSEVYRLLAITLQITNDNLSVAGSTNLWLIYNDETEAEMTEFVSECQAILTKWIHGAEFPSSEKDHENHDFVGAAAEALFESSSSLSLQAYYSAQAYTDTMTELIEFHGWQSRKNSDLDFQLRSLRKEKEGFKLLAFLTAYKVPLTTSTVLSRYCNEIIADLDAFDISSNPEEGLQQLVLLNAILQNQDTIAGTVAKQRLVRFVRKVVGWLDDETLDDKILAESCRVLCALLPAMSDMYGEHWSGILAFLVSFWTELDSLQLTAGSALIPALRASLSLYVIIRGLKNDESKKDEDERNDDLLEAWAESEQATGEGLLNMVKLPREFPDEMHQPLRIFNMHLARQADRVSLKYLKNMEDFYPQLYTPSRSIQEAAYTLLHKGIPLKQEQVSLDAVLEKKAARLPDELLSLVLEAPTMKGLENASFERVMPLQLRGYLFGWMLVFDHFQNASFKVKADYVENIKEDGHLISFLDFTFDFLGHARGRPVDVSKFDITTYVPDSLESPTKDTQWLLTHLYYLSLTYLPSLCKNWWLECSSRQKVISVESWTEKFISPLIMSNALNTVETWSKTQEENTASDEPPAILIRINPRSSELSASYPMDDESSATITITLPPTFPLHLARVTSPSTKLAVGEKRWAAWLRNTQGVIAFSNNSIVDGILAWRRNVFGALKGQTECAICYAVVGEDGKLPQKKCRTCRNSFHGGCLYKWFRSSSGSTCPLCRNNFNYG